MSLDEIISYINEQRHAGRSDDEIRAALIKSGWGVTMINEAMGKLNVAINPVFGGNLSSVKEDPEPIDNLVIIDDPSVSELPGLRVLMKETFLAFKKYWWMVLAGSGLLILLQFIAGMIIGFVIAFNLGIVEADPLTFSGSDTVQLLLGVIGLGLVLGLFVGAAALLINVSYFYILGSKGAFGLKESYRRAFKKLKPTLWTNVLMFLVVLGGMVLLLIPGIFFSLWYSAAYMVVLTDHVSGFEALKRSKFYIRKRLTGIIWRSFVFSFIVSLPFTILAAVFNDGQETASAIETVLDLVRTVFVSPLMFLFSYKLFGYVKAVSLKQDGKYVDDGKNGGLKVFVGLGVVGMVLLGVILVVAIGASMDELNDINIDEEQVQGATEKHVGYVIEEVDKAMEVYFEEHGEYPSKFTDLVPKYYPNEPLDLISKQPYEYSYFKLQGGKSYRYCVKYNMGIDEKCQMLEAQESDDLKDIPAEIRDIEADEQEASPSSDRPFTN